MTHYYCTVDVNLYRCWVVISFSDNPARARAKFDEELGPLEGGFDGEALCSSNGPHIGLFFPLTVSHGTIAHEVAHAALAIFDRIVTEPTGNGEEPFTYLVGALTDAVYAFVRKHKLRITV